MCRHISWRLYLKAMVSVRMLTDIRHCNIRAVAFGAHWPIVYTPSTLWTLGADGTCYSSKKMTKSDKLFYCCIIIRAHAIHFGQLVRHWIKGKKKLIYHILTVNRELFAGRWWQWRRRLHISLIPWWRHWFTAPREEPGCVQVSLTSWRG